MARGLDGIGRLLALLPLAAGVALAAGASAPGTSSPGNLGGHAERIVSRYQAVFEAPPTRVPSRDAVGGPLLGNGDLGAVISGAPEAQCFWISKNNFWRLKDGHRQGGPRLFGTLEVLIPALAGATYRVEQQLFPALTEGRFTKDGSTVTMRSWVAATDQILCIELSTDDRPVEVTLALKAATGRGSTEGAGQTDALLWATKAFAADVRIPTAAACALKVIGAGGPTFTVQRGANVTVVLAMQSSFDAPEPRAAATAKAQALGAADVDALRDRHRAWWRDFWARSLVEIGDPLLEQRYYLSHYVMGSASRNRDFPPGLFALWVTSDDPRWAGDYHLNYNYQAPFYGLYSSNHIEQADPFDQPLLDFMPRGREYAQSELRIRGVYYPVGIGAKGIQTSHPKCFLGQKCNAVYCLVNTAARWYTTYDPDYARRVYPFVLEVANFWEDYLKLEDGRYVIHDDSCHENSGPDFNSNMSLGLVRNAFELAIDMSTALGVDAARHEKWRHILAHLSGFAVQEKDGVTVFRLTERGMDWASDNTVEIQHVYPAGAIDLDSDPKLLETSRNTIRVLNRWMDGNGMNSIYAAAARVGYDPEVILAEMRGMIGKIGQANGFIQGNVHGAEHLSIVPNAINEMLCMGHHGVLRVFPVWPQDRDARFMSLRVWGAFLVSSERTGGVVRSVRIFSEQGRDCTLVNPWPGKPVDVHREGQKAETLEGDRIVLETAAGAALVVTPAGVACPEAE